MDVRTIMTTPATCCRPSDPLNAAAQIMWEQDCGAVPVVADDGGIAGIVTDRDICMAAYTQGAALNSVPVSCAMANQVFSCRGTDSLETAERLMSDNQIRRLPVVDDDNRPIGMLSLSDIARYAASVRKRNGLDREVTQTLAAISAPRAQETLPPRQPTQPSPPQQPAAH